MKYVIHGKCRKCEFVGLAEDVYKHQEKEHVGYIGVDLNREEILNALVQISIKSIVDNALDKFSYDSIAEKWADGEGNDIYDLVDIEFFGDDVIDVIDSLKRKDGLIKKQFQEYLKNFKIDLTQQKNQNVRSES
jgi:hypothetical protein